MRRPLQDRLAFQQNVAFARLIESAQAIEQRRLAGAIRSDQPENLPALHVEGDAVQRDDAAEHDADVVHRKQRHRRHGGATSECCDWLWLCIIAQAPRPYAKRFAIDSRPSSYRIPSTTRPTFPPGLLVSACFFCSGITTPPSAASIFLPSTPDEVQCRSQSLFGETKRRRAAIECVRSGAVIQLQCHADGMNVVLPFACRDREAMPRNRFTGAFDPIAQLGPPVTIMIAQFAATQRVHRAGAPINTRGPSPSWRSARVSRHRVARRA